MEKWDDGFILRLLQEGTHKRKFEHVLQNSEEMRFQVLLSEVGLGKDGSPILIRHGFRVDQEYFYPASAIKLCAAVAALQVLSKPQLAAYGVDLDTPLTFLPFRVGDPCYKEDKTNLENGSITIGHELRKLFLVSDNDAFNRLFSFVGHRDLNQAMWDLGLSSVRIRHRLSVAMSEEDNRRSEPIQVHIAGGEFTYAPKNSDLILLPSDDLPRIKMGCAYISPEGAKINEPMDFALKNHISLVDLQNLMIKVVRPDIELEGGRVEMSESHRVFLMDAMREYPGDSTNPKYNRDHYRDDYCKFFLPGFCKARPKEALRVINKIGQAYGSTVENCYVQDIESGAEFFLSMVVYTNKNGIFNDDAYEYDVAYDLAAALGEVVARAVHERVRSETLPLLNPEPAPGDFHLQNVILGLYPDDCSVTISNDKVRSIS